MCTPGFALLNSVVRHATVLTIESYFKCSMFNGIASTKSKFTEECPKITDNRIEELGPTFDISQIFASHANFMSVTHMINERRC